MKRCIAALTALTLVSLPSEAKAQGTLVINGDFDTDASGWIATNIGLSGGYKPTGGNPEGFFVLYATPPSSLDPTISQTINGLVPGTRYLVSGDYLVEKNDGGGSPTDFSFGVSIDGVLLFGAVPTSFNWVSFSFPYTASSSSALLSLSSQINGTGVSYAIDNIAMYGVPEPSSLWLMGVGGIVGAMFFRNRRKARSHID